MPAAVKTLPRIGMYAPPRLGPPNQTTTLQTILKKPLQAEYTNAFF
jgi:hypothetical protein